MPLGSRSRARYCGLLRLSTPSFCFNWRTAAVSRPIWILFASRFTRWMYFFFASLVSSLLLPETLLQLGVPLLLASSRATPARAGRCFLHVLLLRAIPAHRHLHGGRPSARTASSNCGRQRRCNPRLELSLHEVWRARSRHANRPDHACDWMDRNASGGRVDGLAKLASAGSRSPQSQHPLNTSNER